MLDAETGHRPSRLFNLGSEVTQVSLLSTYFRPVPGTATELVDAILPGPEQVQLMGASIARIESLHNRYLITDAPISNIDFNIIDMEAPDHSQLTLEILRSQREFFQNRVLDSPYIVCDPDLLFLKTVGALFHDDFDIALTARANRRMPFNSGIFFVNNRHPDAAFRFWDLQVRAIEADFMADAGWYGDQLVLRHIIENRATKHSPYLYEVDGLKIRILDGAQYNYSPPREHPYLFLKPDVHVFHFKGRCRSYMKKFYEYYIDRPHDWFYKAPWFLWDSIQLEWRRKREKALYWSANRISPKCVEHG